METSIDVLKRMYLPEFLTVEEDGDYSRDDAVFDFTPREPVVSSHEVDYITPRGLHLNISQALYCFYEHIVEAGQVPFDLETAREIYFGMRLRIAELNQRFRREMGLDSFQGKFHLDKLRVGSRNCLARFSFDVGNGAIAGDLAAMISPHSVVPTNVDAIRV